MNQTNRMGLRSVVRESNWFSIYQSLSRCEKKYVNGLCTRCGKELAIDYKFHTCISCRVKRKLEYVNGKLGTEGT